MIAPITSDYDGQPLEGILITSPYNIEVRMRKPIMLAAPVQAEVSVTLAKEEAERMGMDMLKYIYISIMAIYHNKEAYQEELSIWESSPKENLKGVPNSKKFGFYSLEDVCLDSCFPAQLQKRKLAIIPAQAVGHILEAFRENPTFTVENQKLT